MFENFFFALRQFEPYSFFHRGILPRSSISPCSYLMMKKLLFSVLPTIVNFRTKIRSNLQKKINIKKILKKSCDASKLYKKSHLKCHAVSVPLWFLDLLQTTHCNKVLSFNSWLFIDIVTFTSISGYKESFSWKIRLPNFSDPVLLKKKWTN